MASDFERWEREGFRDKKVRQWSEMRDEISRVYDLLVNPVMRYAFDTPFQHTCRAYVMSCFSWIDLLAGYWNRKGISANQSQRMTVFMNKYMGIPTSNAHIAIHIWRHPLAHEAGVRVVKDTKALYVPYETWKVIASEHMFLNHGGTWQDSTRPAPTTVYRVSLGLFNLMDDIEQGMMNYFDDLATDPILQEHFTNEDDRIANDEF